MVLQLEIVLVTDCLQIIPMTLIIHDWCLMLGDEIDLVWKQPTRTIVIFYVAIRYFPIALVFFRLPSFLFELYAEDSHQRLQDRPFYIMAMLAIMALVQVLLQMRLYAMYLKSRAILWTNAVLFFVEFTVVLCLVLRLPVNEKRSTSFAEAYVAPLCYELYLAVLAVGKCWHDRKLSRQLGANSTLDMLARGSALYFIFVACGIAISMVFLLFAPDYIGWLDLLANATSSIGGARLILSVQRSFIDEREGCTKYTSNLTSLMEIQPGSFPNRDRQSDE